MHSPLEPSIGFNKMQFILGSDGTRQSAHRAYLPRDFTQSHRGNLHICTKTMATRVGTEKTADGDLRARSLELQNTDNGNTLALVHRIIFKIWVLTLSNTYQALENMLQPLTLLKQVYNYLRYGTGWFIGTFVEVEIFAKSSLIQADGKPLSLSDEFLDSYNPSNLPDFGVMVTPISDPNEPGANKSKGFLGLIAALLLSKSYGTIRLASTDPQAHPVCDMNYLSSPDDWVALRAALRVTVAVANEMRAEGYPLDDILVPGGSSDEALDDIIRRRVETMYHYSSSCRMAPEDDTYPGVVDDELRVHGFSNLRIADASIFPDVPAAHPQALIYAVAEKCADMVTISNPAEVAKTRLQLQGELARDGGVKVYKNTLDVVTKTWKNEGIRGVQRGLGPAPSHMTYSTNIGPGAAILESDWPTSNQFYSVERSLDVSLELAKALGCASNSSTVFDESMAVCVRDLPTEEIVATSYDLNISWEIIVDGDLVLTDIATSIKDGMYGRVPTIWATNECEYCFFIPSSIPPNSPPSAFPDNLSIWFNSTDAQAIMNVSSTLYPYETAPQSHKLSGAVFTLAQLMTDYYLHCPMLYLSSLETNTTNPGNSYKVMFAVGLGSTITANPVTCPGQVCHADELYWVFATAETDNLYQPLTPSEVATTQEVNKRWTSLAWTGTPNYEGALVEWPPYTGDNEVIINATATESIQPYRVAQCDFIESQLGLVFGQS
ncbi:hypothetical protein IEO21_01694 [Rhodonia placenta]|uniref:Glucose-methanol-choline oxidoreductase C-terminal domain-containing protein n=1 Tax=Rhodonia placenta TaxID=104341 RepID=A0A8H7P913_9APHY|nr:hypothetical protein IEO21_01694 [Postia placenta]